MFSCAVFRNQKAIERTFVCFTPTYKKVMALEEKETDSNLVRESISNIRQYMKTLTGEIRLSLKDRFPIHIAILEDRLSEVRWFVQGIDESRKNKDDFDLLSVYIRLLHQLRYGAIPFSNLKNMLSLTLSYIKLGIIKLHSEKEPDDFICSIGYEIPNKPVLVIDVAGMQHYHEEDNINKWFAQCIQSGHIPISPSTSEEILSIGEVDQAYKELIDFFMSIYRKGFVYYERFLKTGNMSNHNQETKNSHAFFHSARVASSFKENQHEEMKKLSFT